MYRWLRPLLFQLPPETAHAASVRALWMAGRVPPVRGLLRMMFEGDRRPVKAFGIHFKNPIGLAAGYDKSALAWRGLEALGFGHVELGTVTPKPQPGNPRPRVFRVPDQQGIINRLGFPNDGAEVIAHRLRTARAQLAKRGCVLGINIGKQKTTPLAEAHQDYTQLIQTFGPLADYLAINVSSPNTPGLRSLQAREPLEALLKHVALERDRTTRLLGRTLPILVKLSPDLDPSALEEAVGIIADAGMDGIIATNTTAARPEDAPSSVMKEQGGLSGGPLTQRAVEVTRTIRALTSLPIVGVGGIMSADDAARRLDAGATLLQIYTGLVYRGPGFVKQLTRGLAV